MLLDLIDIDGRRQLEISVVIPIVVGLHHRDVAAKASDVENEIGVDRWTELVIPRFVRKGRERVRKMKSGNNVLVGERSRIARRVATRLGSDVQVAEQGAVTGFVV